MKVGINGRWVVLTLLVILGFAGMIALAVRFVRLPASPKQAAPTKNTIGIARLDGPQNGTLLNDQILLDPVPLFVPTQWNSSQPEIPELTRRDPGAAFQPFVAKYAYSEATSGIGFPEPTVIPVTPVGALTFGRQANPLEVWGHFEREEQPLPARVAHLEVVHIKTGRVVLAAPLTPPNPPAALATADWQPLELVATVDATGLIGTPMLTRGSGVDAVDAFLRGYLSKQFQLGERLPAGFYVLRVGP